MTIADSFARLSSRSEIVRQLAQHAASSQEEVFFGLALAKNLRNVSLRNHFSNRKQARIFISSNISGFEFGIPGVQVDFLEKNFFQPDGRTIDQKKAMLDDAIVIVNNNDVGHQGGMTHYGEIYQRCDKTIFIAWDWDNHHWLDLSTYLAAHSDVYAPAHHENLYLLSRFNWLTAGPVYCSSVQWPRRFLVDSLHEILLAQRSSDPLGMHIPYAPFNFRSRVLVTLGQHYSSIGFRDRKYHVRTPEQRLKEWYSHKIHWIVPVLNDIPIRIFDALVTGGIPIVPESLRFMPPISMIPEGHVLYYCPADIVNPKELVARANELFDRAGADGIVERHRFALDRHHGDYSVRQMLGYASRAFGSGRSDWAS